MKSKLFCILFVLLPIPIFGQEFIQVNTQYNPADKENKIVIEIVNKSDGEMGVSNAFIGELKSFLEIYFLDENDNRIEMSILHFPFMNAPEVPKNNLLIKSNSSLIFKYSYDSFVNYCKYPDRIKKLKIKYYIRYFVVKNEKIITEGIRTYEQFSKTISIR